MTKPTRANGFAISGNINLRDLIMLIGLLAGGGAYWHSWDSKETLHRDYQTQIDDLRKEQQSLRERLARLERVEVQEMKK